MLSSGSWNRAISKESGTTKPRGRTTMGKGYFQDKVAIVTGSSRGIGRATALELARRGASVVLNGRNGERLSQTHHALEKEGYRVLSVQGDVTVPADCRKIIQETTDTFGRIDILVNNAGIIMRGAFEEIRPEVFKKVVEADILGAVFPTMAALPALKESGGSVLFISSVAGLRGFPMASPYSASKMALTAIAESLKVELAGSGVHVGVIYVSFTENDPEKTALGADGSSIRVAPSFQVTQEKTARAILRCIQKRRFRSVHTLLGKLGHVFQMLAPRLFDRLLVFSHRRVGRLYQ